MRGQSNECLFYDIEYHKTNKIKIDTEFYIVKIKSTESKLHGISQKIFQEKERRM